MICHLYFSTCSLCIYWAPSRELHGGAPFLGNGIWPPYIIRRKDKNFQICTINISIVVCILVFALYVYIEIPQGRSTIIICFVICILVCAPYLYIWLPLGSTRRELHFWQQRVWLLTYSGAMTKIFWGLQSIFVLLFASGK